MNNYFTLCDNIRLIELASELHNETSEMDLALFIQVALTDHLHDASDSHFEIGDYALMSLSPTDGVVRLTTYYGRVPMNFYEFYGIKDWTLPKLINISDELARVIDEDLHSVPGEEPGEYYSDFGER